MTGTQRNELIRSIHTQGELIISQEDTQGASEQ